MKFRKLRIAWSVACVVVCVLLIVLWVRSYWRQDCLIGNLNPYVTLLNFSSDTGQLKYTDIRRDDLAPSKLTFMSRRHEDIFKQISGFDSKLYWGFGIRLIPNSRSLAAPHWFPVVLSAILSVAPWLRWHFSLRNLLIATTLFAVVLGLAFYVARKQPRSNLGATQSLGAKSNALYLKLIRFTAL